ncbi:MAG: hypothetical protein V7K90_15880 [Nostoc sp.]
MIRLDPPIYPNFFIFLIEWDLALEGATNTDQGILITSALAPSLKYLWEK